MQAQEQLISAARDGDKDAFEKLITPHLGKLRSYAHRMLGHPEDAEDVVQDALLQAHRHLDDFRGDASIGTWMFSIVTRLSLNHLRQKKRWRWDAQRDLPDDYSWDLHEDPSSPARDPDFVFDVREHIAFCFTCVGRSLLPDQQAAVLLRDVFEYKNREAAKIMGVSESVFRHTLARGRAHMEEAYEGLCALVNKKGICYQCSGLRESFEAGRRGPAVPVLREPGASAKDAMRKRLAVVRDAALDPGPNRAIHDEMLRRMASIAERAS